MTSGRDLELAPVSSVTWWLLLLILLIGPLVIGVVYLTSASAREQTLALGLTMLANLAIVLSLLLAARRRSVTLDGAILDIRATFYRRRIPLADIALDQARVIDLREHPEFRPWLKTNGFALLGFSAGNFRDRRKNRLFCLITDSKVLLLPLVDGRRLLLSFRRPAAALQHLVSRS